jgi:hypothetical protein
VRKNSQINYSGNALAITRVYVRQAEVQAWSFVIRNPSERKAAKRQLKQ